MNSKFDKLTIGILKKIIANLPNDMEVCFDADQECMGTYGFYEWKIQNLIDINRDKKLNDKLVLIGGGENFYLDEVLEE